MANDFNFGLIAKIKGDTYVKELRKAVAIKETWGYPQLKAHPAEYALYKEAKRLPTTVKEALQKETVVVLAAEVAGNSEVPQDVKDNFAFVQAYLEEKGLNPLRGLHCQPCHMNGQMVWWATDDRSNGLWYTKRGHLAKPCDSVEGAHHSAISTYANRIKRGLPLYGAA